MTTIEKISYPIEEQVNNCLYYLSKPLLTDEELKDEDKFLAVCASLKSDFEWVEHCRYEQLVPKHITTGDYVLGKQKPNNAFGITSAELQTVIPATLACCTKNGIKMNGFYCIEADSSVMRGFLTGRRINIDVLCEDGGVIQRLISLDGVVYTCDEYREKFLAPLRNADK